MIKTKIDKKEFEKILFPYDIGHYAGHEYVPIAVDNTVYFLKTNKGKYTFKVLENSDDFVVKYEADFTNYLKGKGVPVQEIIKDNKGNLFKKFRGKNFFIFRYIDAKHKSKLTPSLVKEYAEKIGFLHKVSLEYKTKKHHYWFNKLGHQFRLEGDIPEKILGFTILDE